MTTLQVDKDLSKTLASVRGAGDSIMTTAPYISSSSLPKSRSSTTMTTAVAKVIPPPPPLKAAPTTLQPAGLKAGSMLTPPAMMYAATSTTSVPIITSVMSVSRAQTYGSSSLQHHVPKSIQPNLSATTMPQHQQIRIDSVHSLQPGIDAVTQPQVYTVPRPEMRTQPSFQPQIVSVAGNQPTLLPAGGDQGDIVSLTSSQPRMVSVSGGLPKVVSVAGSQPPLMSLAGSAGGQPHMLSVTGSRPATSNLFLGGGQNFPNIVLSGGNIITQPNAMMIPTPQPGGPTNMLPLWNSPTQMSWPVVQLASQPDNGHPPLKPAVTSSVSTVQKNNKGAKKATEHSTKRFTKIARQRKEGINPAECFIQKLHVGFDVLLHIFKNLSYADLIKASCVCRLWHNIAKDPSLVRTLAYFLENTF